MRSRLFIFNYRTGKKKHLTQQNLSPACENYCNLLLNAMDISDRPTVGVQKRAHSQHAQVELKHRLFQQVES